MAAAPGAMKRSLVALALVALVLVVAVPAGADAPAVCTLSYPAECQATVEGVKVHCTGVGQVPDCRAG